MLIGIICAPAEMTAPAPCRICDASEAHDFNDINPASYYLENFTIEALPRIS